MRLKAYTLMEIIIVMMLSSIVIGATITVFLNTSRFLNTSNKNLLKTNEILFFERQINTDIKKSDAFAVQGNEIGVFSVNRKIFYELLDSTIVRNENDQYDTFNIIVHDYNAYYFEQQKKDCKHLTLSVDCNGLEYPLVLKKETDNSILVNFEINN